jgi:hypothetical protein
MKWNGLHPNTVDKLIHFHNDPEIPATFTLKWRNQTLFGLNCLVTPWSQPLPLVQHPRFPDATLTAEMDGILIPPVLDESVLRLSSFGSSGFKMLWMLYYLSTSDELRHDIDYAFSFPREIFSPVLTLYSSPPIMVNSKIGFTTFSPLVFFLDPFHCLLHRLTTEVEENDSFKLRSFSASLEKISRPSYRNDLVKHQIWIHYVSSGSTLRFVFDRLLNQCWLSDAKEKFYTSREEMWLTHDVLSSCILSIPSIPDAVLPSQTKKTLDVGPVEIIELRTRSIVCIDSKST